MNDYFCVDNDLCTEANYVADMENFIPSSTVDDVVSDQDEDEELDEPSPSTVTFPEAKESLQKLETFAIQTEDAQLVQLMKQLKIQFEHQNVLLRQNLVQSKITSYFE